MRVLLFGALAVLGLGVGADASARVWIVDAPDRVEPGERFEVVYGLDRIATLHGVVWGEQGAGYQGFAPGRHAGRRGLRIARIRAPRHATTIRLVAYAHQAGRGHVSRVHRVVVARRVSQPSGQPRRFEVTVENLGAAGPLAPGVWALHQGPNAIFRTGQRASAGIEAMAEDGNPAPLVAELQASPRVLATGAFDTPEGASQPGPALPGNAYRFVVSADPRLRPRLSFASMLAQTNDVFVGPIRSVGLFDRAGRPVSGSVRLTYFEAGTEANQAPFMGPDQAPRQSGPDTGAAEGVVRRFSDATRALPRADRLVDVSVRRTRQGYRIVVRNVSDRRGAMLSPITPVFHALHDGGYELFRLGQPAPAGGLEQLAEDGDPSGLVASAGAQRGVQLADAAGSGPIPPGQSVAFTVQPTPSARWLTFATMIARTNDAFIACEGVDLLDAQGRPKRARALEVEIAATLAVYDAGTEANEVPGVGPHTAPLQSAPNSGPADPDPNVRRYADSTNDLAGPQAGGLVRLEVQPLGARRFEIRLRNVSGASAYPFDLSPLVFFTHDGSIPLFREGERASAGLAALATDGSTDALVGELRQYPGVRSVDVATSDGQGGYRFTVDLSSGARYVQFATMIVPSNDAFVAMEGFGLELIDASGLTLSPAQIDAQRDRLLVWDSGSERNQAGAAGPDQPPASHGTGFAEGRGRIRFYDDPVWSLPAVQRSVRVTIRPLP